MLGWLAILEVINLVALFFVDGEGVEEDVLGGSWEVRHTQVQDGLTLVGDAQRQFVVGLREIHVEVFHIVWKVPAFDGMLA